MAVPNCAKQFAIVVHVHHLRMDCGCCCCVAATSNESIDGDEPDDGFVPSSLRVRANCSTEDCSMVTKLGCTLPMSTFRPSIETVARIVASN